MSRSPAVKVSRIFSRDAWAVWCRRWFAERNWQALIYACSMSFISKPQRFINWRRELGSGRVSATFAAHPIPGFVAEFFCFPWGRVRPPFSLPQYPWDLVADINLHNHSLLPQGGIEPACHALIHPLLYPYSRFLGGVTFLENVSVRRERLTHWLCAKSFCPTTRF